MRMNVTALDPALGGNCSIIRGLFDKGLDSERKEVFTNSPSTPASALHEESINRVSSGYLDCHGL